MKGRKEGRKEALIIQFEKDGEKKEKANSELTALMMMNIKQKAHPNQTPLELPFFLKTENNNNN